MAFTEDVFASTQERDDELQKQTNAMRQAAEAARKRYGTLGTVAPTSESFGSSLAAERAYGTGELKRRQAAAEGKMDLAKTVDTRQQDIADRVRQVLQGKEQLQSDTSEAMRRQNEEQALKLEEQNTGFMQKLAEQEFGAYKNAAERMDAMQQAYDKGMLDFQMLDLARNGNLAVMDIQRYFDILKNDLQNQLQDLNADNQYEIAKWKGELEAKSNAVQAIIDGLFKAGAAWATGG